jgi:D-beta-D-heptose 7-phosphate kinase/D-beta-D-heptose 1-phosphate adenosyltransferase
MKIAVLGDIIIDINHSCEVRRNAPETLHLPMELPIYNIKETTYILGGAANVANNFQNLKCDVELLSVIGDDSIGEKAKELLTATSINPTIFLDPFRKTTQKTRLFHDNKMVSRFDIEDTNRISSVTEKKVIDYIKSIPDLHAIVFSDYNKGFLTPNVCSSIISYANSVGIVTFVDPKPMDVLKYRNCFCIKLNLMEGMNVSQKEYIPDILETIKQDLSCENVVLTSGENGMYVNEETNNITHETPKLVVDVTGSGDVVIVVITYMYLSGFSIYDSCVIANYCAGKGVETIGNYIVSEMDIYNCPFFHNNRRDWSLDLIRDVLLSKKKKKENILSLIRKTKILYDTDTFDIENFKTFSKRVVFTNGCFDIIHSAHIQLLQYARRQGDILIVGINSNDSVRRLKGEPRPINDISERCALLRSLGFIDVIIIFHESTPLSVLRLLEPNVIIKGGDYTKDNVIGQEYADEVIIFNYVTGLSSTRVIERIRIG